jgi:PHS family inorganic phosphate transporter-like MFS transporter
MQIYALFMLLGCFTTLCIPETKRKTLEELAGEDVSAPAANGQGAADNASEEIPKEKTTSNTAAV